MTSNDFTDRDAERALRGDAPAALADAAPALAALRALDVAPQDVEAARAGAVLASVAAAPRAPQAGAAATTSHPWRVRAAFAAGVALVGAGLLGGAAAADDAAPGDLLYAVDQALADLGVGDGGTDEAVVEAADMADEGDEDAAVEHIAEAIEAESEGEVERDSATALLAAAEKLRANGSEASAEVHERVAAKLEWMATTDAKGREFGQGVSQHERGLVEDDAAEPEATDGDATTSEGADDATGDVTDDAADGGSGKSGVAKPETTGKPGTTQKSEKTKETGKPATAGKPTTAGKPETAGRP